MGETDGFVKIVTGPARRIVGATIVGPDAGIPIAELLVAATGDPDRHLPRAFHIRPALAEAVSSAADGVHRRAIDA